MSAQQPIQRRSTRLAAKKQVAPSFSDLPELALSAIHDILMHWSEDGHQYIECSRTQDAAAFRSTCKAFNVAAMWPRTLKLNFTKIPSAQATQSLAAMLSKPAAANTQLSLCISRKAVGYDHSWVHRLAGLRVNKLKMPCHSINATLAAACTALPGLDHLVLRISSASTTGSLRYNNAAWRSRSQLRLVTMTVPIGDPPFHFRGSSFDPRSPILDLTGFPALKKLFLLGPVVKGSHDFKLNELPLMLPSSAQVVVDPYLGHSKPTPWARERKVWKASKLPGKAIPSSKKYKEEDHASRERRMRAFVKRVSKMACQMAKERGLDEAGAVKSFVVNSFLSIDALEDMMAEAGILCRSDLLDSRLGASAVADDAVDAFEEEEDSEKYGFGWCSGCGGYH